MFTTSVSGWFAAIQSIPATMSESWPLPVEPSDFTTTSPEPGAPPVGIGEGTLIQDAIVDKNARIGRNVRIVNQDKSAGAEGPGWAIRDESSVHRFRFPAGFVLGAGAIVTVRSGPGVDAPDTLYWGADTTVWSNAGDTALLLEPSGAIADRMRYAG